MYLSRGAAQRIVEHIAAHLGLQVWVVDRSSELLASTAADGGSVPSLLAGVNGTQISGKDGCRSFPLHYADESLYRP